MDEIITQKSDNKNIAMTHLSNYTVHPGSTNENTLHTLSFKDKLTKVTGYDDAFGLHRT